MCATFHKSKLIQCEPAGAPLDSAELAGADTFGAAGTSGFPTFADVGAAGTSECWTGTDDAGALPAAGAPAGTGTLAAGADVAGAELPRPAITPSVCFGDGVTPW